MGKFERVLSMDEVKEKLWLLEIYLPRQGDRVIYSFGELLAFFPYLDDKTSPRGFVEGCERAIQALEQGKCRYGYLNGYPARTYENLRKKIPAIARAVAPIHFAKSVGKFVEQKESQSSTNQET